MPQGLMESYRQDSRHSPQPQAEPLLRKSWYAPLKRLGDIVGALVLLVLTSPLFLLVALLVKLTSRGPVIYSQLRVGLGGRTYTLYKVRSMYHNSEAVSGPKWATRDDKRITPFGRFLRRSHLDEIPQLWNVLVGHMSLIGPRPERPEFVDKLKKVVPLYEERLQVRPGITGLAQVQLPPDSDLGSVRLKIAHDLCYLRNFSFWMDVRIVLATCLYALRSYMGWLYDLLDVPGGQPVAAAYEELIAERLSTESPEENNAPGNGCHLKDTLSDVEILMVTADTVREIRSVSR